MSAELSNSEILAKAQAIRAREGFEVLSPEESELCFKADAIVNSRRSSGIGAIVESALEKIVGERRAAEMALERARRDEAAVEALLAERAALEKNLERQREVLKRLRTLSENAAANATEEKEGKHFLNRFAHADHYSLPNHLNQVALEIAQARIVAQFLPLYVREQEKAVAEAEARVKEISKAVSKL